ncbi:MAG: AraC family transcriptional regulator [Anaerolineae bacterium]|nr:AraC family transcriptional regulator [Anaerolineae bacterium]
MVDYIEPIMVSSGILAQMLLYLRSLKINTEDFLRSAGVDPMAVKSPDARIPIETYLKIEDKAAEFCNDPLFGLHMGQFVEAGNWSILGYMMMNCQTLAEAFEKSGRYSRVIGNLIESRAELKIDRVKITLTTPPHAPQMSHHCFDTVLSGCVRMMYSLTGVHLYPLQVTFDYPRPDSSAEYERIFNCPLLFDQKETSFTLGFTTINTPVRAPNPELLTYFEKYARDFIAEMDQNQEHTRAVTRLILVHLDDEKLNIEKIAREMSLSVRTLQKRLEDEGVIFSELLKNIREKLAKKYLHENYSVEQITYLLGFSDPSAFRKAFKKWVGLTPGEYRERVYLRINEV